MWMKGTMSVRTPAGRAGLPLSLSLPLPLTLILALRKNRILLTPPLTLPNYSNSPHRAPTPSHRAPEDEEPGTAIEPTSAYEPLPGPGAAPSATAHSPEGIYDPVPPAVLEVCAPPMVSSPCCTPTLASRMLVLYPSR